jgi:hypothetical protein
MGKLLHEPLPLHCEHVAQFPETQDALAQCCCELQYVTPVGVVQLPEPSQVCPVPHSQVPLQEAVLLQLVEAVQVVEVQAAPAAQLVEPVCVVQLPEPSQVWPV